MFIKQFVSILIITRLFCFVATAQQHDSLPIDSNQRLIKISDNAFLFRHDTINELWLPDKSLTAWRLNNSTEIFTYDNNKLRIWKQANKMGLWFYADKINDWQMYDNVKIEANFVNDSTQYIVIDDTTRFVTINNTNFVCYSDNEIFLWNNKLKKTAYIINDTIDFQKVNDTVSFWHYADSTILWYLNTKPKFWKISNSTLVWPLNKHTEFWKAGTNYWLWRRKSAFHKWQKDTLAIAKPLDSIGKRYWNIDNYTMIFTDKDSVQLWQANIKKKLWNLKDSIYIWKIVLPKIDTSTVTDSIIIDEEPVREIKKAELFKLNKSVKIWDISDSVKLYNNLKYSELWQLCKNTKLWKLNDSTLVWNINSNTKLSMISDTINLWRQNDSSFVWEIDSTMKINRINTNMLVVNINDSIRYSQFKDSTNIWESNSSVKIAKLKSIQNFMLVNDTTEIWEPNDSTKLWIDTYGEKGKIWTKNKHVNILNINDSTKIWQINENVRLSIINNKLKIWQQGRGDPYLAWKESKGFEQNTINDSIKIWHINKETIIWETKHKIEVWNKNNKLQLYRLNDTSLVWTYNAALIPEKPKKISYWNFSGSGKVDVAQMLVDNWAKGGQNNLSALFILGLQANYKKKKVKWDSDFAYHYGFIKPGEEELRKNEDKIKINSIFNYYAIKKLYYSVTLSSQTQFFKGYKYTKDTSYVVSNWMAPLYYTMAIGMNYYPVKQLSVFFSPLTQRTSYVKDTSLVDQTSYGIDKDKKIKNEPGIILKSSLNWNISHNINVISKLDIFANYHDLKTQSIDWETTFTFKFNAYVSTRLNAHLVYDPNIRIKDDKGKEFTPVQFKEILSIGFFYKI